MDAFEHPMVQEMNKKFEEKGLDIKIPKVYFLNTKNYLPMEAISIFLDHKKEPIHEERLEKSGNSYIYSDSPANIIRYRKKIIMSMNKKI